MKRDDLLEKLREMQNLPTRDELFRWIQSLPKDKHLGTPEQFKVGDIFMHPIFNHPYVLLKKTNDGYLCTLMTSDGEFAEVLTQCKSRFFSDSFIVKNLFERQNISQDAFMGIYDNNKHLKEVLKQLQTVMS